MKVCKHLAGCIFFLFIAPAIAESISCMNTVDSSCVYIAKNKGDDIYIYSTKQSKPVFSIPETESSVETVSFFKGDNMYSLVKESSNSNKSKEILSFNDDLNEFRYFYLTSDVDFNGGNKYWHGVYCFLSNTSISDPAISPLEWAFTNICKKHSETQNKYKYVNSDLFFYIDSVIDGKAGKMQLVALNAKDSDNVDVSNFACLDNCPLVNKFIGKINGKYVIKMSLNINEGINEGYYYYAKARKFIPIKGMLRNKKITLNVEGQNGDVKETFDGILDGNKMQGVWINRVNNDKYPFVLYRALTE